MAELCRFRAADDAIYLVVIAALGHHPVTTKSSGHGLGLMIVREIIAAHAGTVEIQSSKQQGTTVCVRLPLVQTVSKQ
ncbi:ATP-binding protein [Leptolyngbya sp. 7M]|uniref:ATP-binding protein n=1 Tax=Leptolyngbya sp. 7M TaxID=2812896 RepID=UPI001B8D68BE|nr:ATP-binding protein [Leptolyngbya sp. 7M]